MYIARGCTHVVQEFDLQLHNIPKKCIFLYKSEKTFQKNAKICRDDYAKKYSNKVYIGMAVCKGRGDDIHTKLKIHSPMCRAM